MMGLKDSDVLTTKGFAAGIHCFINGHRVQSSVTFIKYTVGCFPLLKSFAGCFQAVKHIDYIQYYNADIVSQSIRMYDLCYTWFFN